MLVSLFHTRPSQVIKILPLLLVLLSLSTRNLSAAEVVSGHVTVQGNQDETVLRDVAREVEELGKAHQLFLNDLGFSNAAMNPLKVSILASREEYETFKAQSHTKSESAHGYYEHDQRHIVTWESAHAGYSPELRRILSHETFHHQIHGALGDNIPLWLDEGLAVLFEDSSYVQGMRLDQANLHRAALSQVKQAMQAQSMMPLTALLQLDRKAFYSNDIQKNYSQAWSFVYFLINDPEQKKNRTLDAVLGAIRLGDNPLKGLVVGSGVSLENLQSKWYAYIEKM